MYAEPRLAEHLDLTSLQNMTNVYDAIFKAPRNNNDEDTDVIAWSHKHS